MGLGTGPSPGEAALCCGASIYRHLSRGVPLSTETHAPNGRNRSPTEQKHRSWKTARLLRAVPAGVFRLVDQGLVPEGHSGCLRLLTFPWPPGAPLPSHLPSSPPPPCTGAEVSTLFPPGPPALSTQSCAAGMSHSLPGSSLSRRQHLPNAARS